MAYVSHLNFEFKVGLNSNKMHTQFLNLKIIGLQDILNSKLLLRFEFKNVFKDLYLNFYLLSKLNYFNAYNFQ